MRRWPRPAGASALVVALGLGVLAALAGGPPAAGATGVGATARVAFAPGTDRVRVIVETTTPTSPEGALSPRAASAQRHAIGDGQAAVLHDVAGTGTRVVHAFRGIPALSLEVTRAGLAALRRSSSVASVSEETPMPVRSRRACR